ncbi:CRISPR-associated endonuclease/helicase Cas3 [bacterium HR30]|nr:CRISPR-associated endonuclease/helicase Cas3 [bacterium HR30]
MAFTGQAWGKRNALGAVHPLVDHCVDVAFVFRALLDNENLARRNAALDPRQKDRLAVIAFLHELGKCNAGFQAKADPKSGQTAGHVMEAMALLLDLHDVWPAEWRALIEEICTWFSSEEQAAQMLLAAISHHGRPVSQSDYHASKIDRVARSLWRPRNGYDPMAALAAVAEGARAAFPAAFASDVPPIQATPALQQRFAGLVMLADWIGSDTQFFPYRASVEEDRLALARQAAERALGAIGLRPPALRSARSFYETFGFPPRPLQAQLAQMDVNEASRLVLVESDTGSGKTEAALAWFLRLYAEGKVDGLYFALPTRVAARELYARVERAIDAAFEPESRPGPVLLAVPGYVRVDGVPALPDPAGTLWDESQDAWRERVWSAERPKRFLAAPIAVGTIDQALLSALKVKHSLLRSVCLDRHLLVVDEVHASDPYMREVLQSLLEGHVARGGWALLLSATLGEASAARFFGRDELPLQQAIQRPYPLVRTREGYFTPSAPEQRRIEVEVSPTLSDDESLLARLTVALEAGARVLVITNTVRRANELFRKVEAAFEREHPDLLGALFALGGVRCPHHGRFAREDRELLDAQVTKLMGKGSTTAPLLLIGTQTLEQSLDIDADWLITDLAPMDVLIQRFGRLHRHARGLRPQGLNTARVLVRVPEKDLAEYLNPHGQMRAPAGLGTVYPDGRVLACTLLELKQRSEVILPQQARALIERTTHPEALDTLPEVWQRHGHNVIGKTLGEIRLALSSTLAEAPFGELHYADKGEKVVTRLGDPTFEIPLAKPQRSSFGAAIDRVLIPMRWLNDAACPERIDAEPGPDGFHFAVGQQGFRYTRFGLEKGNADV